MPKHPTKAANSTNSANNTAASQTDDADLHQNAFRHSEQAHIIINLQNGKILSLNDAAAKLLGYSKKELTGKSLVSFFSTDKTITKKTLLQTIADGKAKVLIPVRKKSGKVIYCEIAAAAYSDGSSIQKCVVTLSDMSAYIKAQKDLDIVKDKLVADNISIAISKQEQIDVKNQKVVSDNISIAELKQKKIDVKNEKLVANNIIAERSKQNKIDAKKEKTVADNIEIAKTKQTRIDAINNKLVKDNITLALNKSDARLAQNNAWIKYIAKTSYDVMWDWDLDSGKIYVGESIHEVFGYKVKNNTMALKDICTHLVPEEKDTIQESLDAAIASRKKVWKESFMFRRHDRSVATTICRASIIYNDEGKAERLIGAIQDISKMQDLEKELHDQKLIEKAQGEKFLLAAKLSFDVIWDWNLKTNEVFIGEGFEEISGYAINDNKGHMITDWVNYIHKDDRKAIEKKLRKHIASSATHWEDAYRVTKADGSIAKVYARASIMRSARGTAYRMIGAMQDLSRQKALEEELDHAIKLKEKQIADAAEDAKEMERSNLGKELHDNINQLLGASRMYLEMAKKGGVDSAMYLGRSSEYTLTAIEEIRKLSKGLTTNIIKSLGLCIAIDSLAEDMAEVNPVKISCSLEGFDEKRVSEKFKLNLFRIVQEHLNNILKHAKATNVEIKLAQKGNVVLLGISDDGVGFDTSKHQSGIGVANIKSRAATYHGVADFVSKPGKGCVLNISFPAA